LAKHDEISSTERLLDLIREKGETDPDSPDISPSLLPAREYSSSIKKVLSFKKSITVGVDIGYNDLKLVEINRISDKKQELMNILRVPFESDITRDSPQFPFFLKSALHHFCEASTKVEIWSAISSANVDTRYLRIPKVPKKQVANAIYWTYRKEISINDKNQIFDFEILGEIIEDGVRKIEVLSYSAPKQEINELKRLFSKIGYPLTGISIVPFALQNLFRTNWIKTDGKNICTLFIGRDWSRIAIFSKGNLVLSRDIKAGMKSMVEAIREKLDENLTELSGESVGVKDTEKGKALYERLEAQTDQAQEIFYDLVKEPSSLTAKGAGLEFNEEGVFEIILPALERVVRQVERTLEHFYLNFGDEVVSKVFISGQASAQKRMFEYIKDQLGLPIETIDPFSPELLLSSAISIPESESERGGFVPAMGMALSNNSLTPNFIFTHKDKEKFSLIRRINYSIFAAFLFLISIGVGVTFWQDHHFDQKKTEIAQLQRGLDSYGPLMNQDLILKAVAQTNRKMKTLREFGHKYQIMAVISEISEITPSNIRLLSIDAVSGGLMEKKDESRKKTLVLEGIVLGDRLTFEASLAGYLVRLKNSSILGKPNINRRSFEFIGDKEVLRFTVQIDLA